MSSGSTPGVGGYDVIVVGAGPAGCAAAARLLDDGCRVLLLDEGPGPERPAAVTSLDALAAVDAPGWTRSDVRLAGADADGDGTVGERYWVGRGAGGGSAVNAMVLTELGVAGHDRWVAATGDPAWSAERWEPHRREVLDRLPTMTAEPGPLGSAVAQALTSIGLDGVTPARLAAQPGGRVSLVDALLAVEPGGPLRPRLDLRLGLGVRSLLVDGPDSAVGSGFAGSGVGGSGVGVVGGAVGPGVGGVAGSGVGGADHRVRGVVTAAGEEIEAGLVVVCAGALASPGLVESVAVGRSVAGPGAVGLGAADQRAAGLGAADQRAAGQGATGRVVGRSGTGAGGAARAYMDHPSFAFTVALPSGAQVSPSPRPPVSVVGRCRVGGSSGADSSSGVGGGAEGVAVVIHVLDHVGAGPDGRAFGAVVVALAEPAGWGSVTDGPAGFVVRPPVLTDSVDGPALATAVRAVGERLADSSVSAVVDSVSLDDAGTPLDTLGTWSEEELMAWLAHHPGPVRHPTSTLSSLSPTPPPVLPSGVLVADASVLPTVPDANPQLPIMVNAWRLMAELGSPK
ncbi:MAG: GMC family oxidoreductase N-terminal domain-containing protein [Actinomycetota bacterium]